MRTRLTYANVTATLALFVALGGGAYAAVKLPAHSVGTRQLKGSAVVATKVKNKSLLGKDFKPGELPRGATDSSFSSHAPAAVGIGTTDTQVMALTDGFSGGFLTVGFDALVLVDGSIWVKNTSASPQTVSCRLKIAPQNGAFITFSNYTISGPLAPNESVQVPLVGAVHKPAGTYNVNVTCTDSGAGTAFLQGDLTALAVALDA